MGHKHLRQRFFLSLLLKLSIKHIKVSVSLRLRDKKSVQNVSITLN